MEQKTELKRSALAILAALVVTSLAAGPATAQDKKVYRWVDEDGNVHYTESLPPEHRDRGHDLLNERGIVLDEDQKLTPQKELEEKTEEQVKAQEANELPRDSSGLPRPKPLYTEAEKQQRMDNFLMLRYESEQEIIEAMNVEIKQLNYDRRLLEGTRQSTDEAWRGQIREAANKQRAGMTVGETDVRQIDELKAQLADNERELAALERREEEIRTQFQAQVERYREVVAKYAEDSPN
jgi:hypothetical protein